MSKYGNKKVKGTIYGDFDSQGEYQHYLYLKERQRQGDITILERQVTYKLIVNGKLVCKVVPDYRYTLKSGLTAVSDYKGLLLPISKLKYKLLDALYDIPVVIVTKPGQWLH